MHLDLPTVITAWLWPLLLWSIALGWVVALALLALTARRTPDLEDVPGEAAAGDDGTLPTVTAIVPARNEGATVAACVRSLLGQQGVRLRVVAVDDRSEDDTGAQLEALAREEPRLAVLRVRELPEGWLGKNHANHLAARQADGEVLLFTDGDVLFQPRAVVRALILMRRHGLGHLAVAPRMIAPGHWERAFQATFAWMFALNFRLWRLQVPGSGAYVGVGACNLVRRADYARIGGHVPLAMEVVDDVKLGLLLRRGGTPSGFAAGRRWLSVRWQPGFRASLRGLQKNLFAGTGWRWGVVLAALLDVGAATMLPWLGLISMCGVGSVWGLDAGWWGDAAWAALWGPALAGVLLPMVMVGGTALRLFLEETAEGGEGPPNFAPVVAVMRAVGAGLSAPVVVLAFLGALLSSAVLATVRGGIAWRETFYPLSALRAGCVRASSIPRRDAPGWASPYPPRDA